MNIGTRDNNLPELFDKLNSHQDIEEEFVSIPKGEKLLFFWKECKQDEVDSASIIEKTRQKIRYNTIKRKRSHILVVSASIAASYLVCISTIYLLELNLIRLQSSWIIKYWKTLLLLLLTSK